MNLPDDALIEIFMHSSEQKLYFYPTNIPAEIIESASCILII